MWGHQVSEVATQILAGKIRGRVVVILGLGHVCQRGTQQGCRVQENGSHRARPDRQRHVRPG